MKISTKINLIPRYNWDYGFSELLHCLFAIPRAKPNGSEVLKELFSREPLFTNAGRTSLYTILKSLNLASGSEVGVPLYCCPVVFDAISQAGLIPKFIDINIEDYCLSPADLEKKIANLKALVIVHMFGNPANMSSILSICDQLPVVEDCAQSLFSKYNGTYTGTLSGYSFFSFRSGKYLSAGEGSAIFIDNATTVEFAKKIVDQFQQKSLYNELMSTLATYIKSTFYKRPVYGTVGYPLGKRIERKINLTAKTGFTPGKIGKSNLALIEERITDFIENIRMQRSNAEYFLNNINNKKVILPYERPRNWNNFSQFTIRLESESKRDKLANFLFAHGVDSAKYGDEIMDITKSEYAYQGDCPNSELVSKTLLVIPNHYTLNHLEIKHIADRVNEGSRLL